MNRLYILIPNIEKAKAIVKTLRQMEVAEEGIHVIVKDEDKLEMTQLLQSSVFKTTDFLGALVKGAILGGITGLVAGVLIVKFPPEEFTLGGEPLWCLRLSGLFLGRGLVL